MILFSLPVTFITTFRVLRHCVSTEATVITYSALSTDCASHAEPATVIAAVHGHLLMVLTWNYIQTRKMYDSMVTYLLLVCLFKLK